MKMTSRPLPRSSHFNEEGSDVNPLEEVTSTWGRVGGGGSGDNTLEETAST